MLAVATAQSMSNIAGAATDAIFLLHMTVPLPSATHAAAAAAAAAIRGYGDA
jgi:hypothetical protein